MKSQDLLHRLYRLRWLMAWEAKSPDVVGDRKLLVERLVGVDRAIEVVKKALEEPLPTDGRKIEDTL